MNARYLLVVGLLALTACNDSSSAEPDATAPPPTAATSSPTSDDPISTESSVESTSTVATSTTEVPTTSEPGSDTTTVPSTREPDADPSSFDDLGPQLGSVPGVDTPGEIVELVDMVALFVPSEVDPNDVNVAPPLPEDIEIIAAYGRAMQALYGQVTQNPIPVEPSAAMAATFLDGGAKYSENVFGPRMEAGQHLEFQGDGDVLRPVVLADPRSEDEAFIFDCALSGSNYVNADGTLVDGETPGVELAPLLVRLVRVDRAWIVDDIQDDDRACR